MRATIRLACGTALLCGTLGACMMSQVSPYGVRQLSEKDVADSLAVLAMLEDHIRDQPRDHEAWHRLGMIAWALRERDRAKPPIQSLDWTLLGRQADSALRIAARLKKESISYKRDVTLFLLASGAAWTPLVTQGRVNRVERRGLDEDRLAATPAARAAGIIRVGRTYWRAYERDRDRIKITGKWPNTGLHDRGEIGSVRDMIAIAARPDPKDTSDADYQKAEELFREAYQAAPDYPVAFPQLAMVLIARNRWTELAAFANHHLRTESFNSAAWLALGLATHRLGDEQNASTAFGYALQNMHASTRQELDRLPRVLKPSDTSRYAARKGDDRAVSDRAFWMAATPLWSYHGADLRTEFLARVAYAELRWSMPELSHRGVDSERGRIHVRYGPPDLIAGPDLVWVYNAGPVIVFDRPDGMGDASLDRPYSTSVVVEAMPAIWDNVANIRVENMTTSVTRFRAGDSVDVYVTAHPPIAQMLRTNTARSVDAHVWLITRDTLIRSHDSLRVTDTMPVGIARRVPAGAYAVRAEAIVNGAPVGALGTTSVVAGTDVPTGFNTHGFGVSDVLFASRVSPRGSALTRWSDFDISPHIGPVSSGGTLDVLWETYELGAREGSSSYDVAITVARSDTRGGLTRIAAEVVGAVGSVIGVDRRDNSITSRFTRTVAPSHVIPDHVTIGLGDTPPGVYTMTLEVTDKSNGRTATRTRALVVR